SCLNRASLPKPLNILDMSSSTFNSGVYLLPKSVIAKSFCSANQLSVNSSWLNQKYVSPALSGFCSRSIKSELHQGTNSTVILFAVAQSVHFFTLSSHFSSIDLLPFSLASGAS